MGSVWKRLQRVNKRAAKFQFTSSYHDLKVETTAKWRPTKLSVVWTRRSRRVASIPLAWEPDMVNPLVGRISWPVPDNHTITVTLFKDPRTHELEDKDWAFLIEDISQMGKKRVLASANINMRKYASIESTQQSFTLTLKPVSRKITSANLELTISCVFLREGKATDEDMQSVISLMSVNNNFDVAPLDDLEDIPDLESSGDISEHVLDFTNQLELLTSSLNDGLQDLETPISVPSLSEDPTPLAENNHSYFHFEQDELDKEKSSVILVTPTAARQEKHRATTEVTVILNENVLPTPTIPKTAAAIESIRPADELYENYTRKKCPSILRNDINFTIEKNFDTETKKSEEKIEKVVIESPDKNNEKEEDIKINIVTVEKQQQAEISKNEKKPLDGREKLRSELQPLNLKKSYETNDDNDNGLQKKIADKVILKERTPGQDLLEWCKEVTKDYTNVKVTNLTTSWRNGMAFCAVIDHFESNLIDMSKLSPHDVVANCRMAFDAAESLGIPRVIEPRDMNLLAVPDKLAVMTYLHQLRAHFTGKQLQIEQIGQTSDESSYVIGNYKTDNLSQNVLNLSHLKVHLQQQTSLVHENRETRSPTHKKDVKNLILANSKNLLVKVLSPTKDKNALNATLKQQQQQSQYKNNNGRNLSSNVAMLTTTAFAEGSNANQGTNGSKEKPILMTRRELTDPFGSDDEDDHPLDNRNIAIYKSDSPVTGTDPESEQTPQLDPATTNKFLLRHKEMTEKARAMMEKLKFSTSENGKSDEERQQLRERARRLIAETRLKSLSLDSPTSPIKPITQKITLLPERTISPINTTEGYVFNQINGTRDTSLLKGSLISSPSKNRTGLTASKDVDHLDTKISPSKHLEKNVFSSLQSFNSVLERISPRNEKRTETMSYIESELEALEREQVAIDQKASSLERKLRAVMGDSSNSEETEEQLLSKWFTLVNKKNALLRRQMQLNILEQENDLERKYALLNQELRAALSVEDWRKSEEQREREALLLAELVAIVDKRDQLVQHLHSQEKAIADDDEIERELEHVDISSKEKCVIQ